MGAKTFIDTNVIVYANDRADIAKQDRAVSVVSSLIESGTGVVSTQVLMEYAAVATRRLGQPRAAITRQTVVLERLEVVAVSGAMIRDGLAISERYRISFWDGVIIAAAVAARCSEILSEDFSCDVTYHGVRVTNPFN